MGTGHIYGGAHSYHSIVKYREEILANQRDEACRRCAYDAYKANTTGKLWPNSSRKARMNLKKFSLILIGFRNVAYQLPSERHYTVGL